MKETLNRILNISSCSRPYLKKHSTELVETYKDDGVLSELVTYRVSERIMAPFLKYSIRRISGKMANSYSANYYSANYYSANYYSEVAYGIYFKNHTLNFSETRYVNSSYSDTSYLQVSLKS